MASHIDLRLLTDSHECLYHYLYRLQLVIGSQQTIQVYPDGMIIQPHLKWPLYQITYMEITS